MQEYKKNAFIEAELRCSNAIQNMEKRLRAACHASDANVDNVVKVSVHILVLLVYGVGESNLLFFIIPSTLLLLTKS